MTKDQDSFMHWYNERQKGAGVCIVFKSETLISLFAGDFFVGQVDYDNKAYLHEHFTYLKNYIKYATYLAGCSNEQSLISNLAACGFVHKHESFRGENEVRIATLGREALTNKNCQNCSY